MSDIIATVTSFVFNNWTYYYTQVREIAAKKEKQLYRKRIESCDDAVMTVMTIREEARM